MRYLTLFFCTVSFSLLAQNYYPFPDSNATWYVVGTFKEGSDIHYEFRLEGDTLIDSFKYSKIYNYSDDNIAPNRYIGAIREDSLKRVYFYGNLSWTIDVPDSSREFLLYQFGLNVGDSIPEFKLKPSEPPRYILSIDSIKIGGEYRLRYNVSNPYLNGDYWIEGIGSEAGLFGPYSHEFENHWILYCFQQNGKYVWPDTTDGCLTTSVENIKIEQELKVYPNPAHTNWHIQSEKPGILELYSLSGKKILSKQIQSGTEQINISQFVEGIYFYRINSENGELMKSGKLVKN